MNQKSTSSGAVWVWTAVVALGILHQDFWWWDDATLVFGFMPIGLFYHAVFSLAAAGVWALAVRFAWPAHLEEWASRGEGTTETQGGRR